MKTCSKCGLEFCVDSFYKDRRNKDGLRTDCKTCSKTRSHGNYERNREHRKTLQKEYYIKNSEEVKAYVRKWRQDNPNKTKEYHRQYAQKNKEAERIRHREKAKKERLNHPERLRERGLRWRLNNPEKVASKNQRRRAQTTGAKAFLILDRELEDFMSRPCSNCGKLNNQTLDHIVPLSRGGRHSVGNLQTLCKSCNSSKGSKTLTEWKHSRNMLGVG